MARDLFAFFAIALSASVALLHCSSPSSTSVDDIPMGNGSGNGSHGGYVVDGGQPDVGTKQVTDTGSQDAAPPPAKKTTSSNDGGTTTTASAPGPTCTQLNTCCSKLSNSLEQVGCLLATGKKNELICAGALVTFNCSTATSSTAPTHGASCSGLTSGALYCGSDGVNGDPNTLYQCSGSNAYIVKQCTNGCTINDGVDDQCATTSSGGSTGSRTSAADCTGKTGAWCGNDGVGGSANTLYQCDNGSIASSQACSNGCVTNSDPTLDDYCATSAPSSGGSGSGSTGTSTGGASCENLPDYKYCGSDGVNGDADTLYTCSGGQIVNQQACSNGCTVGSSTSDDYCAASSGGSCGNLPDGTYCGDTVGGDANQLYTCQGGSIAQVDFCSAGCSVSTDTEGSDTCN